MAYQNVGTPRFYIDQIQYLKSIGFDFEKWYEDYGLTDSGTQYTYTDTGSALARAMGQDPDLFTFNFETQKYIVGTNGSDFPQNWLYWALPTGFIKNNIVEGDNLGRYIAFINHDLGDRHYSIWSDWGLNNLENPRSEIILNADDYGYWGSPKNDGVTIFGFDKTVDFNPSDSECKFIRMGFGWTGAGSESENNVNEANLGGISYGTYYDMPHSPELDVTMTIKNDGFDAITTQGGAHLANIRYNGAPMWERADGTQVPPWTIGEPTAVGRRRGRRFWSMNFKYLSDKDLFASNYMSNNYTENPDGYDSADLDTDADNNEVFYYTLDNDDSFVAQVLNKIGNGQRFIFQPDNTNNNPDQFAICQLDQDSLKIKQVANGVYDISLKIREVW